VNAVKLILSEQELESLNQRRLHYDSKTKECDDFSALDYIVDGVPLSDEVYHNVLRAPLIEMLELHPECDVLDIGCGTGLTIKHIEDKCRKVIGCDISEGLISRYKGNAELFVAAAHEIEYPPESFDRIYMMSVALLFPSFDYFKNVIDNCLTMLRDDGILVVSDQLLTVKEHHPRYLSLNTHELIDFLEEKNMPYSLKSQNRLKRSFSKRSDIIIYKDKNNYE
jgi:SAM-dependent methyltransferase